MDSCVCPCVSPCLNGLLCLRLRFLVFAVWTLVLAFAFLSVYMNFHVVLALVFLSVFMGSCVYAF